jgi:hypothetical protein
VRHGFGLLDLGDAIDASDEAATFDVVVEVVGTKDGISILDPTLRDPRKEVTRDVRDLLEHV